MKINNKGFLILATTLLLVSACQKTIMHAGPKSQMENDNFQLGDSNENRSQIINGTEVLTTDSFSHSTIALYMPKEAPATGIANFCTGTLIAKNVILTAAHCISDVSEMYLRIPLEEFIPIIRVGFGMNVVKKEDDPQIRFLKVKKVYVHPEYRAGMVRRAKRTPMPDLALLLLEEDAPEGFEPAKLATDVALIKQGQELTLAGFGVTSASGRTMPTQMMKTNVTIGNPSITSAQFTYNVTDGKSACFADSGGPAYIEIEKDSYVLAGVTSWGDAYCAQMGAYTSVPAFAQFIADSVTTLQQP